jgi:hypothetical protein
LGGIGGSRNEWSRVRAPGDHQHNGQANNGPGSSHNRPLRERKLLPVLWQIVHGDLPPHSTRAPIGARVRLFCHMSGAFRRCSPARREVRRPGTPIALRC